MNKKDLKNESCITVEKLLRNYYLVDNEIVIDLLSSLSHKELKMVGKDYGIKLVSVPFDSLERAALMDGEILLVVDTFNNLAPYKNPQVFENYEEKNHNIGR